MYQLTDNCWSWGRNSERSHLRPPRRLLDEVFWASPTRQRLQGKAKGLHISAGLGRPQYSLIRPGGPLCSHRCLREPNPNNLIQIQGSMDNKFLHSVLFSTLPFSLPLLSGLLSGPWTGKALHKCPAVVLCWPLTRFPRAIICKSASNPKVHRHLKVKLIQKYVYTVDIFIGSVYETVYFAFLN